MVEPILAAQNTWWAPTNSAVTRASITEIEIMDSYTPDSSVTVVDTWDASAAKDGSVTCYVIGTKLIISGNGSGKIAMNEDSANAFGNFSKTTSIMGTGIMDTSNATNMSMMFFGCGLLTTLDLSGFNTSKVTNMSMMFYSCGSLTTLDLSGFNTSKVTDFSNMVGNCGKLVTLDLSNFDTSNATAIHAMFAFCNSLTTLTINKFILRNVTSINSMFNGCKKLTFVDVSGFDTSSIPSFSRMFLECSNLKNLDVSGFNTSNCTNASFMFYGCSSLGEIDVSNWDVSNVTNFDHFAAHANLKRKGIENWKTTSATNMNALFHNCAEEELDLSGWDVSKNQFFCQMFENSPNLKRIKGLENWDTSSGVGFDGMFERCSKLEEVDLSSFNTMKAKNGVSASTNGHTTATMNNMFLSCNNLKKVTVGPNFSINGDGTNTTAANKAILPTPSSDYIDGADGNWYTFNGDSYAPNAMKDKTAETYYASYDIVADMDVICKNGSLIDTAKAIREKNGTTTQYNPSEFGAAIRALT